MPFFVLQARFKLGLHFVVAEIFGELDQQQLDEVSKQLEGGSDD